MAVIAILGAGMMGSALAFPLFDAGHQVRLVGSPLDGPVVTEHRTSGRHPRLDLRLPSGIRSYFADELGRALDGAEAIVLGVSSAGVGWACSVLREVLARRPLLMITKGLEWDGQRLRTLPEVVDAQVPGARSVAVAGPCIAGELARRVETTVVITGHDAAALQPWAARLTTPYYHVRTSTDVTGVEICAALKNAYAMGIAFPTGAHEASGGAAGSIARHNAESFVFAQAIVELSKIVRALGGDADSAAGLAGAGDLTVTCNGGRTGRFGRHLGRGLSLADAIAAMDGATLECLEILRVMRSAHAQLQAAGLGPGSLPLLGHLAEVGLDGAAVALPVGEFFR